MDQIRTHDPEGEAKDEAATEGSVATRLSTRAHRPRGGAVRLRASSRADPARELLSHVEHLHDIARSFTQDGCLAEDLVQDTIEKAWGHLHRYEPRSDMRGWLYVILRNTYSSHRRRSWRETCFDVTRDSALLVERPTHDPRLMLGELARALARLPPERRRALILVGVLGVSYKAAAQTCDVAVGTIKSRICRARQELAESLGIDLEDVVLESDKVTAAVLGPKRYFW